MAQDLHLHFPHGMTGTVHLPFGADGAEQSADADVSSNCDSGITDMLNRFEAFDAASGARKVHEALVGDGWQPFTPKARGGKAKSEAAYIRFVYAGRARTARLYINSVAAYVQGIGERARCAELRGADIQPNGDVYFHFSGDSTLEALEVGNSLRAWADGTKDGV